jgi:peroxiredoxin
MRLSRILALSISLAVPGWSSLQAQRLVPDSLRASAPAFSLTLWNPWAVKQPPRSTPDSLRTDAPTFSLPQWAPNASRPTALGSADLAGQVVVLDFWSRSCRPCIPIQEALVEQAPVWQAQGVRFVSILSWDTPQGLDEFLREHGGPPPFPILLDSAATLLQAFGTSGVPMVAILDHHGKVAWQHLGGIHAQGDLPRLLPPLLAARDGRTLPRNPNRLTN